MVFFILSKSTEQHATLNKRFQISQVKTTYVAICCAKICRCCWASVTCLFLVEFVPAAVTWTQIVLEGFELWNPGIWSPGSVVFQAGRGATVASILGSEGTSGSVLSPWNEQGNGLFMKESCITPCSELFRLLVWGYGLLLLAHWYRWSWGKSWHVSFHLIN